jgi:hypothetical protein
MQDSVPTSKATTPAALPSMKMSPLTIAGTIVSVLVTFLFHFGAARLSYLKYQSIGWAILDFFFAVFYYPFYALVLAQPVAAPTTMFGGASALKGLLKMLR